MKNKPRVRIRKLVSERRLRRLGDDRWRVLLIVLLVALPIRVYLWRAAAMISRDGATFIWYAQQLAVDPIGEMRQQAQHPLYPAMVLAAHQILSVASFVAPDVLGDPVLCWEVSAKGITLLGGLAVVVAAYALGRAVFDRRVGLAAALLAAAAAEFCQLSADALTDMPHLAVFLFALVCGLQGIRSGSTVRLWLAGLLSGVAYLIRPEGLEVALVTAAAIVMLIPAWSWSSRIRGVGAVLLGAGMVASPYMLVTGKLVQKKSVTRFIGVSAGNRLPTPHDDSAQAAAKREPVAATTIASADVVHMARAVLRIIEQYARSLRVTLILPALWWLLRRARMPADLQARRVIAMVASVHLLILFGLILRFDYLDLFSVRHVLVLAALTLPFSAAGVVFIVDSARSDLRPAAVLALAGVLVGPTLPWMLAAPHAENAYLRRAGEWIRAHDTGTPRVQSTRHPVAFYANGIRVWSPLSEKPEEILAQARQSRPNWLVFDQRRVLKAAPDFFNRLEAAQVAGEEIERMHTESSFPFTDENVVLIYRYQAPQPAATATATAP